MNKKGFVSTTIIFSICILFLMMLLTLLATYSNNRITLAKEKNEIKTNLTLKNKPQIENIIVSDITVSSFTITVMATERINDIFTYYYSSDGGTVFVGSNSNKYIFNNLSSNTYYNVVIYVTDTKGNQSDRMSTTETTLKVPLRVYITSVNQSNSSWTLNNPASQSNPTTLNIWSSNVNNISLILNIDYSFTAGDIISFSYSVNRSCTYISDYYVSCGFDRDDGIRGDYSLVMPTNNCANANVYSQLSNYIYIMDSNGTVETVSSINNGNVRNINRTVSENTNYYMISIEKTDPTISSDYCSYYYTQYSSYQYGSFYIYDISVNGQKIL